MRTVAALMVLCALLWCARGTTVSSSFLATVEGNTDGSALQVLAGPIWLGADSAMTISMATVASAGDVHVAIMTQPMLDLVRSRGPDSGSYVFPSLCFPPTVDRAWVPTGIARDGAARGVSRPVLRLSGAERMLTERYYVVLINCVEGARLSYTGLVTASGVRAPPLASSDAALLRLRWWAVAAYACLAGVVVLGLYTTTLRELRVHWVPLALLLCARLLLCVADIATVMAGAGASDVAVAALVALWRGFAAAWVAWMLCGPVLQSPVFQWRAHIVVTAVCISAPAWAVVVPEYASALRSFAALAAAVLLWGLGLKRMLNLLRRNKSALDLRAANDVEYDRRGAMRLLRGSSWIGLVSSVLALALRDSGALHLGPANAIEDLLLDCGYAAMLGALAILIIMFTRPGWLDANAADNSGPGDGVAELVAAMHTLNTSVSAWLSRWRQRRALHHESGSVAMAPIAPPMELGDDEPLPERMQPSAPDQSTDAEDTLDAESAHLIDNSNNDGHAGAGH